MNINRMNLFVFQLLSHFLCEKAEPKQGGGEQQERGSSKKRTADTSPEGNNDQGPNHNDGDENIKRARSDDIAGAAPSDAAGGMLPPAPHGFGPPPHHQGGGGGGGAYFVPPPGAVVYHPSQFAPHPAGDPRDKDGKDGADKHRQQQRPMYGGPMFFPPFGPPQGGFPPPPPGYFMNNAPPGIGGNFMPHPAMRPLPPPPPSRGICLALQCDTEQLSDYQILVRQQLELFEAGTEDVESNTQGRKKPVVLNQVGLRCRHCAAFPLRSRGRGAVYYPAKLQGIYQAAQNMAGSHLCTSCQQIPAALKDELKRLRSLKDNASGGKQYWADGCRALGLYEVEQGLRLKRIEIRQNETTEEEEQEQEQQQANPEDSEERL